ncbi:tetratricopeptide repeat protein [Bacillus sinesaloumensis]|uniref:tetratricopeptide repeat protein n=1 Tax=Litchfieldia sinesaloumensis TaxID=1926280 RepID=UPI00190EE488|nr:tetratricopeptide repeat protein [Bacillus sinesaloumensis]
MEQALELRKEGKLKESNERLLSLVKEFPDDPQVNYQVAWSFDVLGLEEKAISFYEKAIKLGLDGEDLEGAILGLGSTYRTLGLYEKSSEVLIKGVQLFPENQALKAFFAMTLYNLNRHQEAMELLLKGLAMSSKDKNIQQYKRAIEFYADKLDDVWN